MNDKIGSTTNSEDKKLGYYFCKAKDGIINAETFVGKVIFYIWNDVFKDFAEDAGDLFKDTDGTLLSFNKFYAIGEDGKTRVVEEKVEQFLQNLGVEFREKLEDDIIQNDMPYGKHKYLNSISFPDKTVLTLENRTHFVLYLDALKKIGLDKVYPLISKMKYKRLGFPLMTLEKFQEIDNSTAFSYHQEGKYYIVKGVSDETLINILSELDKELNLQLSIDYTVR